MGQSPSRRRTSWGQPARSWEGLENQLVSTPQGARKRREHVNQVGRRRLETVLGSAGQTHVCQCFLHLGVRQPHTTRRTRVTRPGALLGGRSRGLRFNEQCWRSDACGAGPPAGRSELIRRGEDRAVPPALRDAWRTSCKRLRRRSLRQRRYQCRLLRLRLFSLPAASGSEDQPGLHLPRVLVGDETGLHSKGPLCPAHRCGLLPGHSRSIRFSG